MANLTADTDVFSTQTGGGTPRAVVMFNATRQPTASYDRAACRESLKVLDALADEGWCLSLRGLFDAAAARSAKGIATGFTHAHDFSGVFEAPSVDAALDGTIRLERSGWGRGFATEWLIGVREFAPIMGAWAQTEHEWAFLALWEWNDQWCVATPGVREAYDLECDAAFRSDLDLGVNIAGRYRFDWSHGFHHLGAWEIADPESADTAIRGHEQVADFRFTTSRHIIGRVTDMADLLQPVGAA